MAYEVDYSCDVILACDLVRGGDTLVVTSSLIDLGVFEGR
jgi:hypothetical protein